MEIVIEQSGPTIVLTDSDGNDVQLSDAASMVLEVAEQGPPGESPAVVFTQASAASTWTVNHNLGYRPSTTVYSTGGAEIMAEVVHSSVNQLVVYVTPAMAGSVRLV